MISLLKIASLVGLIFLSFGNELCLASSNESKKLPPLPPILRYKQYREAGHLEGTATVPIEFYSKKTAKSANLPPLEASENREDSTGSTATVPDIETASTTAEETKIEEPVPNDDNDNDDLDHKLMFYLGDEDDFNTAGTEFNWDEDDSDDERECPNTVSGFYTSTREPTPVDLGQNKDAQENGQPPVLARLSSEKRPLYSYLESMITPTLEKAASDGNHHIISFPGSHDDDLPCCWGLAAWISEWVGKPKTSDYNLLAEPFKDKSTAPFLASYFESLRNIFLYHLDKDARRYSRKPTLPPDKIYEYETCLIITKILIDRIKDPTKGGLVVTSDNKHQVLLEAVYLAATEVLELFPNVAAHYACIGQNELEVIIKSSVLRPKKGSSLISAEELNKARSEYAVRFEVAQKWTPIPKSPNELKRKKG